MENVSLASCRHFQCLVGGPLPGRRVWAASRTTHISSVARIGGTIEAGKNAPGAFLSFSGHLSVRALRSLAILTQKARVVLPGLESRLELSSDI